MDKEFGMYGITRLVSFMGESFEYGEFSGSFEMNGNTYNYDKEGDYFVLASSDGRKLSVKLEYDVKTTKREPYVVNVLHHGIDVNYYLKDGSRINGYSVPSLDAGYEAFMDIPKHEITHNMTYSKYNQCNKKECEFGSTIRSIKLDGDPYQVEFEDNCIKYDRGVVDYNYNLTELYGEKIDLDRKNSFDYDKEIAGLKKYAADSKSLDVKDVIERASHLLGIRKEFYSHIDNYNNKGIPTIKKASKLRNEISRELNSGKTTFDDDEISKAVMIMRNDYLNRVSEQKGVAKVKTM